MEKTTKFSNSSLWQQVQPPTEFQHPTNSSQQLIWSDWPEGKKEGSWGKGSKHMRPCYQLASLPLGEKKRKEERKRERERKKKHIITANHQSHSHKASSPNHNHFSLETKATHFYTTILSLVSSEKHYHCHCHPQHQSTTFTAYTIPSILNCGWKSVS